MNKLFFYSIYYLNGVFRRELAASAPCGASCIEVAVEAATHGCCVAQTRQRHGGRFLVLASGAVMKNSRFLGVLRRRAGRGERRGGGAAAGWWCGIVRGHWRLRLQRACRRRCSDFGDFGAALRRRVYGAARTSRRQLGRAARARRMLASMWEVPFNVRFGAVRPCAG